MVTSMGEDKKCNMQILTIILKLILLRTKKLLPWPFLMKCLLLTENLRPSTIFRKVEIIISNLLSISSVLIFRAISNCLKNRILDLRL
jgi:hypothetical protein